MSPAAALLTILAKADLSETEVVIRHSSDGEGLEFFALYAPSMESPIARSDHPAALVKYAWANGAKAIRHDYDLKLAEP